MRHLLINISATGWMLLLITLSSCGTPLTKLDLNTSPVHIQGIDGALRDNVMARLKPELTPPPPPQEAARRLRLLALKAPRIVAKALEPFGYYAPSTDSRIEGTTLNLHIKAGEPVRVSRLAISFEGDPSPDLVQRLAEFPLREGDIFNHGTYEKGKEELLTFAENQGFLRATFQHHTVRVAPQALTAEIELTLSCGPRYRVGEIRFKQDFGYPEPFLRRFLVLNAGDPLTQEDLATSRRQLRGSDRFDRIDILPEFDLADPQGLTPVTIELTPKARREIRPGIGYGTDTGARFSLRYRDQNMLERGHELLANGMFAELESRLNLDYIFPGDDLNSSTTLKTGFEQQDVESYESNSTFAEVEQLWGIGDRHLVGLFSRYQIEESDIAGEELSTQFLLLGVRYRLSRLDSATRPSHGYLLSLEFRDSNESLLSDVSVSQLLGSARLLAPLTDSLLLHLRTNAATSFQQDPLEEIPVSLRFFAGGDRSVRGYAYQSLGPQDAEKEVVGGKHLLTGTLEVEWRLLTDWSVAGFYDTGNAFNNFSDLNLAEGAGTGLRYYSLVGPIWLDVARTIGTSDPSYRLHFGIGITW